MLKIAKAIWLPMWAVLGPVAFVFCIYVFYDDAPVSLTPVAAQQSEAPVLPTIDKNTGNLVRPKALEVRFEIQNLSRHSIDDVMLDCENDITRDDVAIDNPHFSLVIPNSFRIGKGESSRQSCYVRDSPSPITVYLGFNTMMGRKIIKKIIKVSDKTFLYVVPFNQ